LAVGAFFALYGVCSLYNWIANILGNIRFRPQQSPPATDAVPPNHPSKLTLLAFGLQQVFILLATFLVFLFTYILQRREDGVIDSALSRRVVSRPIYMPSWRVQLPGRVPKSPLQPSFHWISPGVFFKSRSCCPSAGGPCFGFFLFLPQPEEQAASSSSWGPSSSSWGTSSSSWSPSSSPNSRSPSSSPSSWSPSSPSSWRPSSPSSWNHSSPSAVPGPPGRVASSPSASLVLLAGRPLHHQPSLVFVAGRPLHHQPSLVLIAGAASSPPAGPVL
jgi:hypothetical protein